jgi:hypothetical protein
MESEARVAALHREALTLVLYAGEEDRDDPSEAGGVVVLECAGLRSEHLLDAPHPDDHRIAHAVRELTALVAEHAPDAAAIAVTLRGAPDPHEILLVCAADRDGAALATAVHAIPTSDGVLAPGPQAPLDEVARALPDALERLLGRQALDDPA